jgi:transcriptional regulator with XRE-family HTH domain
MRKARRMTGTQLGKLVGISQSMVSRIENGIGLPDPVKVGEIARALGGADGEVEQLVEMAERANDRLTDLRPDSASLANRQQSANHAEGDARTIRVFQPAVIPGLLQTSEYSRAVLAGFQRLSHPGDDPRDEAAIAAAVSGRIQRQEILADQMKSFHFILTEAALTNRLAPPEHMPAQILRIREISAQQNVSIAIVPADATLPVAPMHGFELLDETTLFVDIFNTGLVSHGKNDGRIFRQVFELYAEVATADIDPFLDRYRRNFLDRLES